MISAIKSYVINVWFWIVDKYDSYLLLRIIFRTAFLLFWIWLLKILVISLDKEGTLNAPTKLADMPEGDFGIFIFLVSIGVFGGLSYFIYDIMRNEKKNYPYKKYISVLFNCLIIYAILPNQWLKVINSWLGTTNLFSFIVSFIAGVLPLSLCLTLSALEFIPSILFIKEYDPSYNFIKKSFGLLIASLLLLISSVNAGFSVPLFLTVFITGDILFVRNYLLRIHSVILVFGLPLFVFFSKDFRIFWRFIGWNLAFLLTPKKICWRNFSGGFSGGAGVGVKF